MLRTLLPYLLPAVAFAFGFARWRRSGRSVPAWVHVLGVVGLAIGAWMASLDREGGHQSIVRAIALVLLMPALVYWGYFMYGGLLGARSIGVGGPRAPSPPE